MAKKRAKRNNTQQVYKPPPWAWDMIRAYLDPGVKPTMTARCKDAGIDRTTLYRELKKPEFVTWFQRTLIESVISEQGDVRQAHFKLCLKGDLEAIKLWYERYSDFVPTQRVLAPDFSGVPDTQLRDLERVLAEIDSAGTAPTIN